MGLSYDYAYKSDSIYCYPNSNVLINNFNIQDSAELLEVEQELTAATLLLVKKNPVHGIFDLKHLQDIHYAIFSEVYPWAGKLRDVNISKGTLFCLAQNIESFAAEIFTALKKENCLIGLGLDDICDRLAYYLGEINMLHPFREGNGRVQRIFIRYLAGKASYDLDFTDITQEEMIEACVKASDCDYTLLRFLIKRSIVLK